MRDLTHLLRPSGALLAFAIALAACSTAPSVRTDADPSANLSSYQTFSFFDRVSTDNAAYTTILTSHLKDATRRQLEQRGYRYAQSGAQLLVNFHVNVKDRTDVRSTPTGGFYGYRAGLYGMWPGYAQDVETVHYQDGTLSIDLVDAARQQLVWQGVAEARVTKEVAANPTAAIDKTVTDVFAQFPTAAHAAAATNPATQL